MTSSVIGARWSKHPLLEHALGGPTPVEFYLKFMIWDPVAGSLVPVKGATVRVADAAGATLQAAQTAGAGLTDLQHATDAATGEIAFKGMIPLVPSGGLTLHFELNGLHGVDWYTVGGTTRNIEVDDWSTAGWRSLDKAVSGTLAGFSGQKLGTLAAPATFLVGVPCWLTFRYQRKYGENPAALFPSGTRIKIVTLPKTGGPIDIEDFRTDSSSELRRVLFNLTPETQLRMLIFTRFVKAADDPNDLILNPFAVTTGDPAKSDDATASDIASASASKPYLRYDGALKRDPANPSGPDEPAGYAFDLGGSRAKLKDVSPWVPSVHTLCLCKPGAQPDQFGPLPVLVEMPKDFDSDKLGKSAREALTLCSALHAATLVREFHGLISSLLSGRTQWKGLNLDSKVFETALALTEQAGPWTMPIPTPPDIPPIGPPSAPPGRLRGKVSVPVTCLFESKAFECPPGDRNNYHLINFKNIVIHELAHCLMFSYSYDHTLDYSRISDHVLNLFVQYSDAEWEVIPFWEGWAVYYSMLVLGPESFLTSQLSRIKALDDSSNPVNSGNVVGKTDAVLSDAIQNIFSSKIINTYQMVDRWDDQKERWIFKNGLDITNVLKHSHLVSAGPNKGYASEMCLAFSLYSLTAFLVKRSGHQLSALGPSLGDGGITRTGSLWYEDNDVRKALWTAIFEPFWHLSSPKKDSVEKFTGLIRNAVSADQDLRKVLHKILRIFNTYHLLVAPPTITSITPIQSGSNPQTVTVNGTGFVDIPASTADGGMTATLAAPSSAAQSISIAVATAAELTLTATFLNPGDYTLRLIGRWGDYSYTISVKT